jgi:hypothetical protein
MDVTKGKLRLELATLVAASVGAVAAAATVWMASRQEAATYDSLLLLKQLEAVVALQRDSQALAQIWKDMDATRASEAAAAASVSSGMAIGRRTVRTEVVSASNASADEEATYRDFSQALAQVEILSAPDSELLKVFGQDAYALHAVERDLLKAACRPKASACIEVDDGKVSRAQALLDYELLAGELKECAKRSLRDRSSFDRHLFENCRLTPLPEPYSPIRRQVEWIESGSSNAW